MIDTGYTKSFINPSLAKKLFLKQIIKEDFFIRTPHNISKHCETVMLKLPNIFNQDKNFKFYLFTVNENFAGVIGSDLMKELKIIIDYDKNLIITEGAKLRMYFTKNLKDDEKTKLFKRNENV